MATMITVGTGQHGLSFTHPGSLLGLELHHNEGSPAPRYNARFFDASHARCKLLCPTGREWQRGERHRRGSTSQDGVSGQVQGPRPRSNTSQGNKHKRDDDAGRQMQQLRARKTASSQLHPSARHTTEQRTKLIKLYRRALSHGTQSSGPCP